MVTQTCVFDPVSNVKVFSVSVVSVSLKSVLCVSCNRSFTVLVLLYYMWVDQRSI